jgi:hypothetical protein
VAEFSHAAASEEAVMSAAMGQHDAGHDPSHDLDPGAGPDARNGASR